MTVQLAEVRHWVNSDLFPELADQAIGEGARISFSVISSTRILVYNTGNISPGQTTRFLVALLDEHFNVVWRGYVGTNFTTERRRISCVQAQKDPTKFLVSYSSYNPYLGTYFSAAIVMSMVYDAGTDTMVQEGTDQNIPGVTGNRDLYDHYGMKSDSTAVESCYLAGSRWFVFGPKTSQLDVHDIDFSSGSHTTTNTTSTWLNQSGTALAWGGVTNARFFELGAGTAGGFFYGVNSGVGSPTFHSIVFDVATSTVVEGGVVSENVNVEFNVLDRLGNNRVEGVTTGGVRLTWFVSPTGVFTQITGTYLDDFGRPTIGVFDITHFLWADVNAFGTFSNDFGSSAFGAISKDLGWTWPDSGSGTGWFQAANQAALLNVTTPAFVGGTDSTDTNGRIVLLGPASAVVATGWKVGSL